MSPIFSWKELKIIEGMRGTRGATKKVAAYNALDKSKAFADVVCGGIGTSRDDIAINTLIVSGYSVELSEGDFYGLRLRIADKHSIVLRGQGAATKYHLPICTQAQADFGLNTIISLENAHWCYVGDIYLDGQGPSQTATAAPGIYWYIGIAEDANCYENFIDNVFPIDCLGGGIYISGSTRLVIGKVIGRTCGTHAVSPQTRALLNMEGATNSIIGQLIDIGSVNGVLSLTGGCDGISARGVSYAAVNFAAQMEACKNCDIDLTIKSPPSGNGLRIFDVTTNTTVRLRGSGLTVPFHIGAGFSVAGNKIHTLAVSSVVKLDLSGGATDIEIHHANQAGVIVGARLDYTEASSADAGVVVRIGLYQDGVALDDDYFLTKTSEVSKAKGYSKVFNDRIDASDFAQRLIAAGDTLTFGTAGGKVGTGEVLLTLYIAECL